MYRQSENIVSVSKEERSQKKPQFCWLFDLRLLVSRIIKNNTSTVWATKSQSVTLFKASLIYRLTLNSWIWLLPLFMVNISASTLLLIIFICCSRLFFFLSLFFIPPHSNVSFLNSGFEIVLKKYMLCGKHLYIFSEFCFIKLIIFAHIYLFLNFCIAYLRSLIWVLNFLN